MIDHISIGVRDIARTRRFYDAVLAPLGYIAWAWPRAYGDAGAMLPAAAALAPAQGHPIAAIAAPLRHAGEAVRGVEAFLPAIVLLWAAGACTLSLRLAAGVWWLGRLPVLASPQLQRSWQQRLDVLGERAGLRRVVALRLVAALDSPVVVGWWRPVVLLPASLLTRICAPLAECLASSFACATASAAVRNGSSTAFASPTKTPQPPAHGRTAYAPPWLSSTAAPREAESSTSAFAPWTSSFGATNARSTST